MKMKMQLKCRNFMLNYGQLIRNGIEYTKKPTENHFAQIENSFGGNFSAKLEMLIEQRLSGFYLPVCPVISAWIDECLEFHE